MNDEHHHGTDMKFLAGVFIGGLLGAATIFFLGTKEGKKAGKILSTKLEDQIEDLEQKGKDLLAQGEEIKEQVMTSDIAEHVTKKIDSTLAHLEELQEHGRDTTASIRKRLFKNLPKKS